MKIGSMLFISFMITMVLGATTSTTATLVWVTGTNSLGVTVTTESRFTQSFSSFYIDVASPSLGSVGVPSLSAKVGEIRSYSMLEVTATNAAGLLKTPLISNEKPVTSIGLLVLSLLCLIFI